MGIEPPFSEEEFDRMKTKDLADKLFDAALEHYREKARIIGEKTLPVIKNVYENQTHFENIAIPITDGKRGMNVIVNLKKAVENGAREVNLISVQNNHFPLPFWHIFPTIHGKTVPLHEFCATPQSSNNCQLSIFNYQF